jgi:hypothetical protein
VSQLECVAMRADVEKPSFFWLAVCLMLMPRG